MQKAAQGRNAVYGANSGFGKLANQRIAQTDLESLQLNLLRSHAVGVGEAMPERVVWLVLLLKAASLARGFSRVREVAIDLLLALYDHACSYAIKTTPVFTELKAILDEEIRFKVHKPAGLHLASA